MKPKPTQKNPLVTCTKCNGEGMTELSDEYMSVILAASRLKKITASAIAKKIKWVGHPTAINNRLTDLMHMGFFSRCREGRTFVYTPKY